MSVYILDDKTYEVFPSISKKEAQASLTPRQLNHLASVLSEHFGCFILFGMSLQGNPQVMISGSCGMEHLALKKFAEDVIIGDTNVNFVPLNGEDGEEEDEE